MSKRTKFDLRSKLFFALFCAIALPTVLITQEFGESILIEQAATKDLYLAAKNIDVLAPASDDVVAAGQRINIDSQIGGDLITASETLTVQGTVEDDLRAAGRSLNLNGKVVGHVVAAGQHIQIGADADIGDWAWLAGETVDLNGNVNGEIKIVARTILIDGIVTGDADLTAQEIRIGPNGIIHGDLNWRSPSPLDQSETAEINGQVIEKPFSEDWADDGGRDIGGAIFAMLSLAVAAIVSYLVLPGFSRGVSEQIKADYWKSPLVGFLVLIVTPIIAIVLFVTTIGWLVGIALLLAYLFLLVFGWLTAVVALSGVALRCANKYEAATRWTWAIGIFVTAIAVVLVGEIPLIGTLFLLLLWLYGLGSANLGLFRCYSGCSNQPTKIEAPE